MKCYRFSFTDYQVANLYTSVDCFLDYLDEYGYEVGDIQMECLHTLRHLFEGLAVNYFGHASGDSLPVIFEPEVAKKE